MVKFTSIWPLETVISEGGGREGGRDWRRVGVTRGVREGRREKERKGHTRLNKQVNKLYKQVKGAITKKSDQTGHMCI